MSVGEVPSARAPRLLMESWRSARSPREPPALQPIRFSDFSAKKPGRGARSGATPDQVDHVIKWALMRRWGAVLRYSTVILLHLWSFPSISAQSQHILRHFKCCRMRVIYLFIKTVKNRAIVGLYCLIFKCYFHMPFRYSTVIFILLLYCLFIYSFLYSILLIYL